MLTTSLVTVPLNASATAARPTSRLDCSIASAVIPTISGAKMGKPCQARGSGGAGRTSPNTAIRTATAAKQRILVVVLIVVSLPQGGPVGSRRSPRRGSGYALAASVTNGDRVFAAAPL